MEKEATRVLDRMRVLCSRREYCSAEILAKAKTTLTKQGLDPEKLQETSESIVEVLQRDGYIDDARYAGAFVADKSGIAGWGPAKIRYALIMKKIDSSIINDALDGADRDKAYRRLYRLLQTKWKTLSQAPSGKMKLIRFAMDRGYAYEDIRPVMEEIISQEEQ